MKMSRREMLSSAALAALAAATGTWMPRASAASGSVIVGTWGGDYANLMRAGIDDKLMTPQGVQVLQDISGPTERRMKLFAERNSRRGSMDVACLADFDTYAVGKANLLVPVSASNVPRMSKVLPFLVHPYSVPALYSAHVIVYRSDLVKTPPTSFAELWDKKYAGRVGLIDQLFTTNTAIAALMGGGSMDNFAPAGKMLAEWRQLGTKVFPSTDSVAAALKSGDIWMTIVAAARGYMWHQAGIPLAHAVPREGGFPSLYEAGVPKNARNQTGGLDYLNAMLDPRAQVVFASRMGYLPTVSDAQLPPELDKQINFTPAEKERMLKVDYGYLQAQQASILDTWSKTFRA